MQQPKLVIVEDDLLFAQALAALVEDLGYQVVATADTEQGAVEVVNECRPHVVIMDVRLMSGSGLGAASTIRQSSKVPIVFCTSYVDDGAVQSAVQALDNAALIAKPFADAELAHLLANAVKKKQRDAVVLRPRS
jgi:CheY-like chemotaxis protein